jgi:hypothetical protein
VNSDVHFHNYLCLLPIPAVAIAIYFLALTGNLYLRTNMVVYYTTSFAGVALWTASVILLCWPGGKVSGGGDT